MSSTLAWQFYAAGTTAAVALLPLIYRRLQLSLAKHPSLAGHSRLAKRIAGWVPGYAYAEDRFFAADGATPAVAAQRRAGFDRLSAVFKQRFERGVAMSQRAREMVSDLRFVSHYRVPFQFSAHVREHLPLSSFVQSADGVILTDVDGNRLFDLTGSYGVNVLGHDFYKDCMRRGLERAQDVGVSLGTYHDSVLFNAQRLREMSGLDEVSFHMSGTEAVMQAVRLARYHTRRRRVVRFCGAYHGWWEDVQPGPGNPVPPRETYTLRDMHERSLRVLETRRDIACVLVNPLQALHPNRNAPADSALVDGSRRAGVDRAAYTAWLQRLRSVCERCGIVLIFDEVFVGFRLAPGGAQEYFGVQADMVVYGKTLGGGLPVGVVCGRRHLMKRFREDRPGDICFARGTFNAHPVVMGAMAEFLQALSTPAVQNLYRQLDDRWNERAERLNQSLQDQALPVHVDNLGSIWTVNYTQAGRYHWMLQYYLREQGLALPWTGTGRLVFSLNYSDDQFKAVLERFVAACQAMKADGWWWQAPQQNTHRAIRQGLLREMILGR
jgi:glutamate-1-semialdehyde 2,1-aminomutase